MRQPVDALRSVKRHVAANLPDWEVRLADDDGSMQYPYALVAFVGPSLSTGNAIIREVTQPLTVYCYPEPAETFEKGLLQAEAVSDELWRTFVGGLEPLRVPLYDYDGLRSDQGSDTRNEHDYLRLEDVQINRVPDPADDRRIIVVCDFRASWKRSTERLSALRGGPVLQSVRQRIIPATAEQPIGLSGFVASTQTFGRPKVSKA